MPALVTQIDMGETTMATSLEAAAMELHTAPEQTIKQKNELGLPKSVTQKWLASEEFFKVNVRLSKLPTLYGEIYADGKTSNTQIIIDLNINKVNKASGGYVPKVTIVAGSMLVKNAKQNEVHELSCWVGRRAAKHLGVDISKHLEKIAAAATIAVAPGFNPSPVHPFPSPAKGGFTQPAGAQFFDARHYGAMGSELNNPGRFNSMSNITEALSMYLSDLKNGKWKPVSSQWATVPAKLVDATNEAGLIAKERGLQAFSPMDFVRWQVHELGAEVKRKNGLTASKYQEIGDPDDPSTWAKPYCEGGYYT